MYYKIKLSRLVLSSRGIYSYFGKPHLDFVEHTYHISGSTRRPTLDSGASGMYRGARGLDGPSLGPVRSLAGTVASSPSGGTEGD